MSEEIQAASLAVPRPLMLSLLTNGVREFAMILALMFCIDLIQRRLVHIQKQESIHPAYDQSKSQHGAQPTYKSLPTPRPTPPAHDRLLIQFQSINAIPEREMPAAGGVFFCSINGGLKH